MHLGQSPANRRAWRRVRRDYAVAIYYLPTRRVWALSEELNALDRARSRTAGELLGEDKRDAFGVPLGRRMQNAWSDLLKTKGNPPGMVRAKRRR